MRDFDGRCAYSLQHHTWLLRVRGWTDFDPSPYKDFTHAYTNLFRGIPALQSQEISNTWPNRGGDSRRMTDS